MKCRRKKKGVLFTVLCLRNGEMPSRKTRSALKSHEHVSITFLMQCSQRAISKTKTQTSHEHVSIKEQISKGDFDTDFETRGIMCHEHISIKEQRAISKRGIMCNILKLKLNVQYLIFNLSSNKPTPYKKLAKSNTGKISFSFSKICRQ